MATGNCNKCGLTLQPGNHSNEVWKTSMWDTYQGRDSHGILHNFDVKNKNKCYKKLNKNKQGE